MRERMDGDGEAAHDARRARTSEAGEREDDRDHVAICCLTFRRPSGLRRVLDAVADLHVPPRARSDLSVVIVDNDPDGSAEPIVEQARERIPWPVTYVVEPRRGIPHGRNTAVAVSEGSDMVAFIDDDEAPERDWLVRLVDTMRSTDADVATGPVMPVFDEPPPRWVREGRFFERRRHEDGERIHYARTSNVLIRRHLLERWREPFDSRFGLSGGDDTFFFQRAHRDGATIVWSDRAVVREWVPPSRVSARWLRMREYRRGTTLSRCLLELDPRPRRIAKRIVAGIARMGIGSAQVVAGLVLGRRHVAAGARRIWFGAGLLTGLLGILHQEYRTTHGR